MKTKKGVFKNKYILILFVLIIGMFLGYFIAPSTPQHIEPSDTHTSENTVFTCSMHPQIRQNEPGDCPICGMELIPIQNKRDSQDPQAIQMTDYAMKLANVQTMTVGSKATTNNIRLNGKIAVDERLAYSQSTHIPGRIEKLFVNFTGEKVSRGQALARVYSPAMATAQEELLQAYSIKKTNPRLFEAAQEKLSNWRISDAQINKILERGQPSEQFTLTADVSGIVTKKMVELGDYVTRGMPIYEITDLSRVWALFDIYESEMALIEEGSTLSFTVASLPGQTFQGKVDFIDPIVDPQTRVSTARVVLNNEKGKLKPGMFVSGTLENAVGQSGSKEISIPKSAVLWTGKRSVVYVKKGTGSFKMREVVLGPALGKSYIILKGLKPGEEIVINGTFAIDAAAQLAGKPSMMNSELKTNTTTLINNVAIPVEIKSGLRPILKHYLALKNALVNDNYSEAKKYVSELGSSIKNVSDSKFNSNSLTIWEDYKKNLNSEMKIFLSAENLSEIRERFDEFSITIIGLVKTFQLNNKKLYVQHCPMADDDKGADWLSLSSEIKNPYYGSAMLSCGSVKIILN